MGPRPRGALHSGPGTMTSCWARVCCSATTGVREESRRPTRRPQHSPQRSPSNRYSSATTDPDRWQLGGCQEFVELGPADSQGASSGVTRGFGCLSGRTSGNSMGPDAGGPVSPSNPIRPAVAVSATLPSPVRRRCATRLDVYTSILRLSSELVSVARRGGGRRLPVLGHEGARRSSRRADRAKPPAQLP
jgi:hypothetical protein